LGLCFIDAFILCVMWDIFFLTILSLSPLAFKLYKDFRLWVKGKSFSHKRDFWLILAPCYGIISVFLADYSGKEIVSTSFAAAFFLGSCYWLLFDGIYNTLRLRYSRRKNWQLRKGTYSFFYAGSNDPDDALFDDLIENLKDWQRAAIKIALIILSSYLFFK